MLVICDKPNMKFPQQIHFMAELYKHNPRFQDQLLANTKITNAIALPIQLYELQRRKQHFHKFSKDDKINISSF